MRRLTAALIAILALFCMGQNSTGNIPAPAIALSASTALQVNSAVVFCNAGAGAVTITLPPASSGGRFSVIKTDSTANACTVATAGTDTFVGGTTTSALTTQGAAHSYAADGTSLYGVF